MISNESAVRTKHFFFTQRLSTDLLQGYSLPENYHSKTEAQEGKRQVHCRPTERKIDLPNHGALGRLPTLVVTLSTLLQLFASSPAGDN